LRITDVASVLDRPENLVGMHFFNPAHIMKLVEVVSTEYSKRTPVQLINDLAVKLGKQPVMVKDAPGFIVNRVARLFYLESLKILEEENSSVKIIDQLLESSGFRMGPFRLMDLIGVDTNLAITTIMYQAFNKSPKFKPSSIQQDLVKSGNYGKKVGKGFYDYN